jgi:hypothetical protein
MAARTDLFVSPDYFAVDELLTEEQKLIRETVRAYVKKEISPIIEDYAQRAEFPEQIVSQLGELGCFGPTVPVEYGGGGLDYISYGLMMQELERGDSGVRSTASVQGSLVMFPIHAYGSEEQRIFAQIGQWRVVGMLWIDRTRSWIRSEQYAYEYPGCRGSCHPERSQNVDQQCTFCASSSGVGER